MGQRHSRESYHSTSSQAALTGIWSEKPLSPTTPQSDITRPAEPREITRLSNLIDPEEVTSDWRIRSPSGNLLGPNGFFSHPSRPLSVRERQEKVRAAMEEKRAQSVESRSCSVESVEQDVPLHIKKKKKRAWYYCG